VKLTSVHIRSACVLAFIATANLISAAPQPRDPTEGSVARLTARMLEQSHYAQQKFDDSVSSKFLDRYIDALDGLHLHFIEADLKEFEQYRTRLDDMTLKVADTSPAHAIFARFMQRLEERANYANELLKTEKFDFTGTDRYTPNRRTLPRPKDLAEAKVLWRQHLRLEYLQEKLNKKKHDEITKLLSGRYARLLRTFKELDSDEVCELYLTSLAHVYDPHSDYMGHAQLENFAISMKLALFGIGAELQSEDGYCKIRRLMPGGPAAKSKKVKPDDKIIAVAQGDQEPVDIIDMPLSKAVALIRGPKGTKVTLTIVPSDAASSATQKKVSLVRDEISLDEQAAKAKIVDMPGADGKTTRIGVIDLPSFYADMDTKRGEGKRTTPDVARLLRKLTKEKVTGIVLDLRQNGGGSLEEAINLTGLFIKKGPVVQTKDPTGEIVVDADTDPSVQYDGPLIVLTSRFSASASEILAGALQDYGRALVVGDSSTFGKGTVQTLQRLQPLMDQFKLAYKNDPGALKLTIRKFYRASGSSTQLKGVIPDIVLPSVNNIAEIGEASMENALPWDEVPSARFEKVNRVQPYLAELRKRSAQRVASERDFDYLREDIDIYKKLLADRSVSLNEAERIKEKEDDTARADRRKKERHARKETDVKIYDITLNNADLPGLPAPAAKTNDLAAVTAETPASPNSAVSLTDDDAGHDDKTPLIDVTMEETKRILLDFIALMTKDANALSSAVH
jgi:carboxyl-terminal processing protease